MKKKSHSRKLALNRETIAALQEKHLAAVTGGDLTRLSGCQGAYCETGTNCNISFCICD